MQFILKVFEFSNLVGVPLPLYLLFFIVHTVYFLIVGEDLVNPIDWERDPFNEIWKKMRYGKVFLCWALLAALLVDLYTRDHLAMTNMLWVYVYTELPNLLAHVLPSLIRRVIIFRPNGIEILYHHCQLFHSDRNNVTNNNHQIFASSFFVRALKDPGISHLYHKLWLNRGLSKKQKEFQDEIAAQILELSIEEFHRPLPSKAVSRDEIRRSLNNKKLLDVLIKREVSGAKNKKITFNSLYQRFHTDDVESVDEHFQGLLDNEPYCDYGQLSMEQQQLLLIWFKNPIQSSSWNYEANYDADHEIEHETVKNKQNRKLRRKKVKQPIMPKLEGPTDYSLGLIGFLKRIWNRLTGYKRPNRNRMTTNIKPLAKSVNILKPEPRTRPKSDVSSITEPQDTVNEVTKETLNSTIPDPPIAPFEMVNVISSDGLLSATSNDKDAGDNLPKLEFKSKIPIRKPKMVRNRTETRKGPEELQVIPSAGMKPAPVLAAVKSSGDFAPKPFRAKPVPTSSTSYKPPSTMLNKDRPDRRAIKKHLSKPKVIEKPHKNEKPKQFLARPAPPSTYKPTLYPYLGNSRSKRS
ncbi:hypothetical protein DAPPUDRAFT_327237 [Daphnia pulex]|uniref:Uncharacterized protein n=1 Tax=Daphnia pulex TaxID=6669 RepID=E9HA56_DAPPU|nr:hypothetical protein DAPPUDRAFT_327237 [Daphnia pulex]|eukprot:EFX71407.1 hypothetical protein DAPPUDRAFT_327237 [Daphnia pulex]